MGARSWTELFFLHEAIALAAGHRPYFFCRRDAAKAFRDAWASGSAARGPRAAEIDAILRGTARSRARACHPITARPDELPDGAVIAAAGEPYTVAHGRAFRWTARGYDGPMEIPQSDALLTPPSTLGAFRAGYRPVLHPSINAMQTQPLMPDLFSTAGLPETQRTKNGAGRRAAAASRPAIRGRFLAALGASPRRRRSGAWRRHGAR